jgi:hypothetical protein
MLKKIYDQPEVLPDGPHDKSAVIDAEIVNPKGLPDAGGQV